MVNAILQAVAPEHRAAVEAVFRTCPRLSLTPGQLESVEAFGEVELVVVESGFVIARAIPPAGNRRVVLAVATAGAVLAAPSAREHLLALTETRLILVDGAAWRRLLEIPGAAAALVEALLESVHDRQQSLSNFATVSHADRVWEKLLQLGRVYGKVVNGGVRLDLPLTHELVADMVGSARETVTCAFRELADEGLVVREGRIYRLAVAPERLAS